MAEQAHSATISKHCNSYMLLIIAVLATLLNRSISVHVHAHAHAHAFHR